MSSGLTQGTTSSFRYFFLIAVADLDGMIVKQRTLSLLQLPNVLPDLSLNVV